MTVLGGAGEKDNGMFERNEGSPNSRKPLLSVSRKTNPWTNKGIRDTNTQGMLYTLEKTGLDQPIENVEVEHGGPTPVSPSWQVSVSACLFPT